jgi:cytoskeletal protein RodZ
VTDQTHRLGEALRTAREAKGVDLTRAERETKIRSRYLSALERSEYRELPGAVYTRGFLRNYGVYLGLDPEYLIDLYRLETAAQTTERPSVPAPPRPIAARRSRAFVVTPGAVVASILTILVGVLVVWLGWEFVNFARTPELRILEPAGDVTGYTQMRYTIRGITEPNARISVDGLRENPSVDADEEGSFRVTVNLVPGSNVITLTAFDPLTRRDSEQVSRTITVVAATVTPPPAAPAPALAQPAEDAALSGPIQVAGSAGPGVTVEVSATLVSPAPLPFRATDQSGDAVALAPPPPTSPAPVRLTAGADGAFAGELVAGPGTWELLVWETGAAEPAVRRRVTVTPPAGLVGELRVDGGSSYLEVAQDGQTIAGVSGGISEPGDRVPLNALSELRIRAGNAGAVVIALNGMELGAMGDAGEVVEWRITRTDG